MILNAIRKFSVTKKIFFAITLLLVSTVLVIGVFVQRQSREMYSESLDQAVRLIVQKYSADVEDSFQRAESLKNMMKTEILSFAPQMEAENDIFRKYKLYLDLKKKMDSLCGYAIGQDSAYCSYLFLHSNFPIASLFSAPDHERLYENSVNNKTGFFVCSDEMILNEDWFLAASNNQGATYWFTISENSHIMMSAASLSDAFLIDGRAARYSLGTLVVSIDLSQIVGIGGNAAPVDGMEFLITDCNYRILYAKDSSFSGENLGYLMGVEELSSPLTDAGQRVTLGGKSFRLWRQKILDEMYLFTFLPEENFNKHIWLGMQTVLWVLFLVFLVEFIIAAIFSGVISRPIRRLSEHIKNSVIPKPIVYEAQAEDEIGVLYKAYNEMVEKQEELITQIYDSSERQKKLKYQMLQAQVNPHFLYNTLDSVSCMAMMNGEKDLSRTLSALAKLFRYNISHPDELVTLREEIKMVNNYIGIQQFRYENHLCFTCEIPETMLQVKVPKTILQPLVENGIFYGSLNTDGRRHISIYAEFITKTGEVSMGVEELARIYICNEYEKGKDLPEVDIGKMNDYLNGTCELKRRNGGLGILNVQERIRISFGEIYGIHYERNENQVIAVIELPVFI